MKFKMMCVLCEDETWVITEGCDTTALCKKCKKGHEKYQCEGCQGLIPHFRRIRCKNCEKLFCKYHISDHDCNGMVV